jgi:hypothetical protein
MSAVIQSLFEGSPTTLSARIIPTPALSWGSAEASIASFFDARFARNEQHVKYELGWDSKQILRQVRSIRGVRSLRRGHLLSIADWYGSKVILVGTRFGPVVIYQVKPGDSTVLAYQAPHEFFELDIPQGVALSAKEVHRLLGDDCSSNIGYWACADVNQRKFCVSINEQL